MKNRLQRRFRNLWVGEAVALLMFIGAGQVVNAAHPGLELYSRASFWTSFVLLELLLVQGSFYWFCKWKRMKVEGVSVTPARVVRLFKLLQPVNIGLIVIATAIFIVDLSLAFPHPGWAYAISAFILGFAVLEYVNYFHRQLSYDNASDIRYLLRARRLKRASLARDFMVS